MNDRGSLRAYDPRKRVVCQEHHFVTMTVDRITQITCHHAIRDEESDKAKGCKQVPGSLGGCEAFPELIESELNYIPDQRGPKLRGVS